VASAFDAVASLARFPRRCAHAPEEPRLRIGLRQLMFGNYRILFTVDDEHHVVTVPHIRHGSRKAFSAEELALPDSPED